MKIEDVIAAVAPPGDGELEAAVRRRLDHLTKPLGSLGRLEEIALDYCLIRGERLPAPSAKRLYVFCADHGVAAHGVSAYPREVTRQMLLNFASGGAAINVLCRRFEIEPRIVDLGVDADFDPSLGILDRKIAAGTANFLEGPAMTAAQCRQALESGAELARQSAQEGVTLLLAGEMGIGNTTTAAAVGAALLGVAPEAIVGAGTGVDAAGRGRKADAVRRALQLNRPDPDDPLDALAKVGGFEIAAMAGFYLGAAAARVPAVVDGFIATAAALAAVRLAPAARRALLFAHRSHEQGHGLLLEALQARPLLDLDMRLGEGTGAALACAVIDSALDIYRDMATFESAGVSHGRI